jgi:uncharacterized protein YkwD
MAIICLVQLLFHHRKSFMKIILVFITFFSFILVSCKKTSVGSAASSEVSGTAISYNVNKNTLLQWVNNIRQKGCNCGQTIMPPVAPVVWNESLAKAAFSHSSDMLGKNYFDHTSPDGSTPGSRITQTGYVWKTFGENIAMGYKDEDAVMNGWINSEGHCKNIMNAAFKDMGAGREGNYWTQEFGSK